ncbi:hypothetical protein [Azospirillum sp. ST 5-10]|uniref:hypothetical protein n=1 Tax=unclassified Azospirillum TaxID=2630922 RepID=UPI003F4A70B3
MLPQDSPEHAHCRSALRQLDRVLSEKPDRLHDSLMEGLRCLVTMRDYLIARRRAGDESAGLAEDLHQVNAVLSVLQSGTFPMVGVRHERLEKARACLAGLLGEGR